MEKENHELLSQSEWRFVDHSTVQLAFDAIQSFAIDDTLCYSVGSHLAPPTLRAWVHEKTISLGIQDSKLPHIAEGIAYLQKEGYRVVVRNSGGLAVVLDKDVLNLSMILPDVERGIAIERGYEAMFALVKEMFAAETDRIEAKEIKHSYCPGSFDLSIDDKKFAGISQRRMAKGVAVQIYLGVAGNQQARSELIRTFYQISGSKEQTKYEYPEVDPNVMGTLSELLGEPLDINAVLIKLLQTIHTYAGKLTSSPLNAAELDQFPAYYERLIKRNEKVLENL